MSEPGVPWDYFTDYNPTFPLNVFKSKNPHQIFIYYFTSRLITALRAYLANYSGHGSKDENVRRLNSWYIRGIQQELHCALSYVGASTASGFVPGIPFVLRSASASAWFVHDDMDMWFTTSAAQRLYQDWPSASPIQPVSSYLYDWWTEPLSPLSPLIGPNLHAAFSHHQALLPGVDLSAIFHDFPDPSQEVSSKAEEYSSREVRPHEIKEDASREPAHPVDGCKRCPLYLRLIDRLRHELHAQLSRLHAIRDFTAATTMTRTRKAQGCYALLDEYHRNGEPKVESLGSLAVRLREGVNSGENVLNADCNSPPSSRAGVLPEGNRTEKGLRSTAILNMHWTETMNRSIYCGNEGENHRSNDGTGASMDTGSQLSAFTDPPPDTSTSQVQELTSQPDEASRDSAKDTMSINILKSQAYDYLRADETIPIRLDPSHEEVTQVPVQRKNQIDAFDSKSADNSADDDSSMSSAYLHDSSPNEESSSEGD